MRADAGAPQRRSPQHLRAGQCGTDRARLFDGFVQYQLSDGQAVFANTAPPSVPATIAPDMQAVLGTRRPSSCRTRGAGLRWGYTLGVAAPQASGAPKACTSAISAAKSLGADTMSQIASAYAFSKLYGNGDLGAGETVGVIELAEVQRTGRGVVPGLLRHQGNGHAAEHRRGPRSQVQRRRGERRHRDRSRPRPTGEHRRVPGPPTPPLRGTATITLPSRRTRPRSSPRRGSTASSCKGRRRPTPTTRSSRRLRLRVRR